MEFMIQNVPAVCQLPDYSTGCESAAAVSLLNFVGCGISLHDFISEDLAREPYEPGTPLNAGPNPNHAFVGDPSDPDSLGCYAPVIVSALAKAAGNQYDAVNETGADLADLCRRYIDRNMPVILWASMQMKATVNGPWYLDRSNGKPIRWITNEHCLLLIGYTEDAYLFLDPMSSGGPVSYPKWLVQCRYEELGCQAASLKRRSAPALVSPGMHVSADGHLEFGGRDVTELAAKYGTPLYLLDAGQVRSQCRLYRQASRQAFGAESITAYAGKALCFAGLYPLLAEEDMWADVVSAGEIFTAVAAGFPAAHLIFHGSAKPEAELRYAIAQGVGLIVSDNQTEIDRISGICAALGRKQDILLRVTPGIEPHTFAAVRTGQIDSKFGAAIETGQAEALAVYAVRKPGISLRGYHCHIGSQIFESEPFERAAGIMLKFAADMAARHQIPCDILDLGGGMGVPYVASDPSISCADMIQRIGAAVAHSCEDLHLPRPAIVLEPGRSIVAAAGLTVYQIQNVKRIPDYRSYLEVDGGMGDNPRWALYRSRYSVYAAGRMNDLPEETFTVAGRTCESGDVIAESCRLPALQAGDFLAVAVTGAYNYSMASNYNRVPRAALVMLANGRDTLAVRRETMEDLIRCDQLR